jgi:hypothetical protein
VSSIVSAVVECDGIKVQRANMQGQAYMHVTSAMAIARKKIYIFTMWWLSCLQVLLW